MNSVLYLQNKQSEGCRSIPEPTIIGLSLVVFVPTQRTQVILCTFSDAAECRQATLGIHGCTTYVNLSQPQGLGGLGFGLATFPGLHYTLNRLSPMPPRLKPQPINPTPTHKL